MYNIFDTYLDKVRRDKHKKNFGVFISFSVCFLVVYVSFLTPLSIYTPPRQGECFLQLQQIFNKIHNMHNGDYRKISDEEITTILRQNEPLRCDYKWLGGCLSFQGIPVLVCCCKHQSTITNYEKFVQHKDGHIICLCLLDNGNIVFVRPEEMRLVSLSKNCRMGKRILEQF
jgi:hypothetical protein